MNLELKFYCFICREKFTSEIFTTGQWKNNMYAKSMCNCGTISYKPLTRSEEYRAKRQDYEKREEQEV